MHSSEKNLVFYTSKKSPILKKELQSNLNSSSLSKHHRKFLNNARKNTRYSHLRKKRIRKNIQNSKLVRSQQKVAECSSITGRDFLPSTSKQSRSMAFGGHSKSKAHHAVTKVNKKKRRRNKRDKGDWDEASRLRSRARYLLIKMKHAQNLIDAYSGDGWNGQSREKIKPEKELQRAEKQILNCRHGIRDVIRQLDLLSSVGSIEDSVMYPDGSVFHEHDIFKEEVNRPEANNSYLNPADEWPSEDSEDEDYDPESNENSGEKIGGDESFSNDSSSSCSLFYSSDDAISYGESEHHIDADFVDLIVNTDTGEINSCETVSYRRQRRDVDYKKLHDEMFGKDLAENEEQSEDEDWGPHKRKKRKIESDADTNVDNSGNEDTCSKMIGEKISHDKKRLFRIPPNAVQRLREVFAENELPSKDVRENLSKQLGLSAEKVGKWFKNARYTALKIRKAGITKVSDATLVPKSSRFSHGKAEISAGVASMDNSYYLPLSAIIRVGKNLKRNLPERNKKSPTNLFRKHPKKATNGRSFDKIQAIIPESRSLSKRHLIEHPRKQRTSETTFVGGRTSASPAEKKAEEDRLYFHVLERICALQDRIRSMKKAFESREDTEHLPAKPNSVVKNVIYVPVAELKEKTL
ncbi:pathogenesis-related homeodomain protein isoform X2 [Ananas comosus]|uniref:Pathogenesis-related homeodomain protein isoform X2 n=1 Tax=Ananas comosus TaxID=4615 RepID=A0A6P5EN70_ANACO|nr:pathogenesis-related homeodomain protein isoform X2 [Ananas comosus]